ncbi:MAG: MmgE/PrpD family protein [Nitrososphaerales archaeon]|nr:MmgE/PrpD family protein [Nitrososphaerales archaeon]
MVELSQSYSEKLATWVKSLTFKDIPNKVIENIKLRFLDTIGICLASSTMSFAKIVVDVVKSWDGKEESSLIGFRGKLPMVNAALVNGLMAHALDFDDTHTEAVVHPSAIVIPTTLAVGEKVCVDGESALVAAAAGYEIVIRLGMVAPFQFHKRGLHATPIVGTFAASLIAGKILDLDVEQMVNAMGICGSMAAGLQEFVTDGTEVKQLHPGWANHCGIIAAQMASKGFTGPRTVLEGRFGIYRSYLGNGYNLERLCEDLGKNWEVLKTTFKFYPCCHILHSYMDCILHLRKEYGIEAEKVDEIQCFISKDAAKLVCEGKEIPLTPYHAKFSLPYTVALMLLKGECGIEDFSDEAIKNREILKLAKKVKWEEDPNSEFPKRFPGWVKIRMNDGNVYEHRVLNVRSSPENPLKYEDLMEKFYKNACRVFPPHHVKNIIELIESFERLNNLEDLMKKVSFIE